MKRLQYFTFFDFESFSKGKRFLSIGQQEWKDFKTGAILGTKVTVVIAQDKTNYGDTNGEPVNNLYEKLVFKIPAQITVPMNVEVRPVNAIATVFGEFRNQLSITADGIEVIGK